MHIKFGFWLILLTCNFRGEISYSLIYFLKQIREQNWSSSRRYTQKETETNIHTNTHRRTQTDTDKDSQTHNHWQNRSTQRKFKDIHKHKTCLCTLLTLQPSIIVPNTKEQFQLKLNDHLKTNYFECQVIFEVRSITSFCSFSVL